MSVFNRIKKNNHSNGLVQLTYLFPFSRVFLAIAFLTLFGWASSTWSTTSSICCSPGSFTIFQANPLAPGGREEICWNGAAQTPAIPCTPGGGGGSTTPSGSTTLSTSQLQVSPLPSQTSPKQLDLVRPRLNKHGHGHVVHLTASHKHAWHSEVGPLLASNENKRTYDQVRYLGISSQSLEIPATDVVMAAGSDTLMMSHADFKSGADVWGRVQYNTDNQGARGESQGYRSNTTMLGVGGDKFLNDMWKTGVAVSYSTTDFKDKAAPQNKNTADTYTVWGYGAYSPDDHHFIDTILTFGQDRHQATRIASTGAYASKYKSYSASLEMVGGRHIRLHDHWKASPSLGLLVNRTRQGGYTETGGLAANAQNVAASVSKSVQSIVGISVSHSQTVDAWHIAPAVGLTWYREFAPRPGSTAVKVGDANFRTQGVAPAKNTYDVSLSVGLRKGKHFIASVNYDLTSKSKYTGHSFAVKLAWKF